MNDSIFRKKSLTIVKSPDNLNEYIRVANPGIWIVLVAIIVLLLGFCVWSVFGTITTTVQTNAISEDGTIICHLSDNDIKKLTPGMAVDLGTYSCEVSEIFILTDNTSYCTLTADTPIPDGTYDAEIIIETLHPASFLTN